MHEEVSEGTFETVPRSVRGNLKLNDLNMLNKQLSEYFSDKNRFVWSYWTLSPNMIHNVAKFNATT